MLILPEIVLILCFSKSYAKWEGGPGQLPTLFTQQKKAQTGKKTDCEDTRVRGKMPWKEGFKAIKVLIFTLKSEFKNLKQNF